MNVRIEKANLCSYGLSYDGTGYIFSTSMTYFRKAGLKIYGGSHKLLKNIPFSPDLAYGDVFCVKIYGLSDGMLYRYYADELEYPDPYGLGFEGMTPYKEKHSAVFSVIKQENYPKGWDKDTFLHHSFSTSFLYCCHVRGFTRKELDPEIGGTFLGFEKKIGYLTKLGVTGVVLFPTYEFDECTSDFVPKSMLEAQIHCKDHPLNHERINYWGFVPGFYYAKKRGYSSKEDANFEFRHLVMALHKHDLECIETIYIDASLSSFELLSILVHERLEYHVDGFRFVGVNVPNEILLHPLLKDAKMICEHIDESAFFAIKVKEKNVAVMDETFLTSARRFLKGDEDQVSTMAYKLRENPRSYQLIRNITDYCGFSLYDLVSYNRKHNELNGEGNEDGTNYNYSWNCGEEGKADKKATVKLRMTQIINALLMLMLSQATPMIMMGDECLLSHEGNNNPWCQDNELNYFSPPKTAAEKDLVSFVSKLASFRKEHVLLHIPGELKLTDYLSCKIPDLSFHGEEADRKSVV